MTTLTVYATRNATQKIKTLDFSRVLQCGQQDLNLHGLPLEPKSSASANSAMPARQEL